MTPRRALAGAWMTVSVMVNVPARAQWHAALFEEILPQELDFYA